MDAAPTSSLTAERSADREHVMAAFARAFAEKHGRVPRVLHIGNVANNAFHNAKLMRRLGVTSDVVCYDYYHVMACPEWEEADFAGAPQDHFRPDWTTLQMHNYARPTWFVQGPRALCIRYLTARAVGAERRTRFYWYALSLANGTRRAARVWDRLLRWAIVKGTDVAAVYRRILAQPRPWPVLRQRLHAVERRAGWLAAAILAAPLFVAARALRGADLAITGLTGKRAKLRERTEAVLRMYEAEFPDRGDRLDDADVEYYVRMAQQWTALFDKYDAVHAYATDAILPMLCDRPFFALEHGTLRDIPFEPSTFGRLTALSYRKATHVFVTNADCLEKAKYFAGERVSFINHPFDENLLIDTEVANAERLALKKALDADLLFFFPTRHDWTRPGADKANDVFLHAFCRLRGLGRRVGLVCCEWGGDVAISKELLARGGATSAVRWIPPLGLTRFGRMAKACDIVVDQFRIGAFGGVTFKALAFGAPIMTYLDETAIQEVFAKPPPVVNCRTEEDIISATDRLLQERNLLTELSAAALQWLKTYHDGFTTVSIQLGQYQRHLLHGQ